jgi:hypothetical protein
MLRIWNKIVLGTLVVVTSLVWSSVTLIGLGWYLFIIKNIDM